MFTAPADLPDDPATLQAILRAALAEIERLQLLIAGMQRNRFGRRSERLDDAAFEQGVEDLEQSVAEQMAGLEAAMPPPPTSPKPRTDPSDAPSPKRNRGALPAHLPRLEVVVDVADKTCPCCGGTLHPIGEDRAEMLDYIPAQLRVKVMRRPRYGCRVCENAVVQAPAPERPIDGGMATEALLAQVLIGKYSDHLPLYRQAQIFARQGVTLDRSTLCNWVGRACWWLAPLHELMLTTVLASPRLAIPTASPSEPWPASPKVFADDTTLPVLDPGRGRTKTGRLWCYAVDNRPWRGPGHPAAAYVYSEDRKADHPADHLKGFRGLLQVDGYAGFGRLVKAASNDAPRLAFCWARLPKVPRTQCVEWQTRGMHGANSTTSTPQPNPRSPRKPCGGSRLCMKLRPTSAVRPPTNAVPRANNVAARWLRRCTYGWTNSWGASPGGPPLPRPSVTPSTATQHQREGRVN
jgi:transposase